MMKNKLIRYFALLLCLALLFGAAGAENLFDNAPSDGTVEEVTEDTIIDTGNKVGDVVNADPGTPGDDQLTEYSYTPLDVILIMDVSGSMGAETRYGQQVITLAQEAAKILVSTLFELSAPSRIGLITFDDTVCRVTGSPLGLTDENELIRQIRTTAPGGATNTGGAFREAGSMLAETGRPDTRQVVIMLTDGLPVGGGDPNQDAINAGYSLVQSDRLIYTVGLVGALNANDKQTARRVLANGYETRYFEVDNKDGPIVMQQDMGNYNSCSGPDYAALMSGIFQAIVSSAIGKADTGYSYSSWIDGNMEVRVTDADGPGYLSSDPLDYCDSASFGSLSVVGDDKNQKILSLREGHYIVTLRGTRTGKTSYQLTVLMGYAMRPVMLDDVKDMNTHPAHVLRYEIDGDQVQKTDLSWDPLDHRATDPFTGRMTRGSETAAAGRLTAKSSLYAWPSNKAAVIQSIAKGMYVQVLALDEESGWLLAASADKNGKLCRGWLPGNAVSVDGYVPKLIRDEELTYTAAADTQAYTAPSDTALESRIIKSGTVLHAIHAERDANGREWVYVKLESKKEEAVYLPADSLENWVSVCPDGFRIGYAMPTLVWQKTFGGNGYTEFMWAASEPEGSGVVLSGRTSSTSTALKAKYGNRDAIAMVLTPEGETDRSAVWGGKGDMDSFHCIVPTADGYYVSGVTRSNNKDFEGIWDTDTYSGKTSGTHSRSNALIGKLNKDLSINWMKSFGTGDVSFGFDVVVPTTDGQIAGCGWLTKNKGFVIEGSGDQDFLVMKFTDDGRLTAWNAIGGYAADVPDSATATDQGGLMVAGKSYTGGSDDARIWVLDSFLQETGGVTYGGKKEDLFDNVRNLGDGSYLATGFTESFSSSMDYWAVQIDESGRMIWQKTYGGSNRDEVCGTTVLPDGSCLLVGYTTSTDGTVLGATGSGKDAWAVCIDKSGRVIWQYTSDLPGDDWFNSAAVDLADGGIVLAGTRDNKSNKNAKGYAVKVLPPHQLNDEE